MDVNEANPKIIEWLREKGTLVAHVDINHSYPHCWRCHEPVIFRATEPVVRLHGQDRLADGQSLRQKATDELSRVDFYPAHAVKRIGSMVEATVRTGASRASATGACPSRRYTCAGLRRDGDERRHPGRRHRPVPREGRRRLVHRRAVRATCRARLHLSRSAAAHDLKAEQGHPGRLVGVRRLPHRRAASTAARASSSRPTCTWRAPTSTAAGS